MVADVVDYSRLMGIDESGTHRELQRINSELVEPVVRECRGRIVKTMGDGYLIEFSTASSAVRCARRWQSSLSALESSKDIENRIQFRIGINLGEVIVDNQDVFGDGVNVAARLEALCPPGGVCVSQAIRSSIGSQREFIFEDFGSHNLKNIQGGIQTYLVESDADAGESSGRSGLSRQSEVRYCLSPDGTSIAHAEVGEGYPLVFAGSWMTHLEWDWQSPSYQDYLSHLSSHFRIIRYDQRGQGMSDWNNVDIEFDRMVEDMEQVIEQSNVDKIALMGMSQGASISLAYIARNPGKVSHLILNGGYSRGRRRRGTEKDHAESEALVNMIRHGWGADNPAFRNAMTTLFMPDAGPDEIEWFNKFQKAAGPGENMARFRQMFDEMDVSSVLPQIDVPTLILHSDEDAIAPISEGKFLAARIAGARLVILKSKNHMMFGDEPDFPKLVERIVGFVN